MRMLNFSQDQIIFDRDHIWHPYTSMADPLPNFLVKGAQGVYLELQDGTRLVDGTASWWSAIHGYNHPVLNQAVTTQANKLCHVMFGGLTHEPAIELCKRLLSITPACLEKIFLADSGSVAVEVAMKMAMQYWACQDRPAKHRFLTIKKGYHGDTLGAMSVCDPLTGMHHLFRHALPQQYFVDEPQCQFHEAWDPADIQPLAEALSINGNSIAAVILEPIVQATGGIRFYHPQYLQQLRQLCDHHDVLLIFDEIATGFGRSGKLFACQHANIEPDIMCVGKSLTGGYISLAATLTTQRVSEGVCAQGNPLMHGPTFMGNPLACATASASIDLLLNQPWQENIQRIESQLMDELSACKKLPQVADVRCLGAIGVVETHSPVDLASIQKQFVTKGVWIRPFGKLIYIMPPYIVEPDQLTQLTNAMHAVVKAL
ncbi:MAG: adenosylmethionine--8-amino-7-oxononanoate transaminase [Cellvibrionaceae bacterium]|nr:adenosylmethionine--8-amino-7-oxononanoate transaminase [Cellvibrionaceae bacterium]